MIVHRTRLDHIETAPATDQAADNPRRDDGLSVLVAFGSAAGQRLRCPSAEALQYCA
jgi:hypothetical protein